MRKGDDCKMYFTPIHSTALFDRALIAKNKKEGVVAFVMAAASMEAMINDIIAWYGHILGQIEEIKNKKNAEIEKNKDLSKRSSFVNYCDPFSGKIKEEEKVIFNVLSNDERMNFFKKIESIEEALISSNINKVDLERFNEALADLKVLFNIRNEIMHAKSKVFLVMDDEKDKDRMKKYPKSVKNLYQKKDLNRNIRKTEGWFESLECQEACEWCIDVVKFFVKCFLGVFPKDWKISWMIMADIKSGFLD
jgi:hypothetical protein